MTATAIANTRWQAFPGGPSLILRGMAANANTCASTFSFGTVGAFGIAPTGTSTFAGSITNGTDGSSATVNILKFDPNWTLAVSGTNSYTGITQVNAGTLLVNGSHNGGGTYTVAGGATFGGTGQISATVDLTGNLVPGGTNAVGALTIGTLITESGNDISFDVGGGSADKLVVTGSNALNFTNSPANISVSDIGNGTFGRYVAGRLQRHGADRSFRLLAKFRVHHRRGQRVADQQHAQHVR